LDDVAAVIPTITETRVSDPVTGEIDVSILQVIKTDLIGFPLIANLTLIYDDME